LASRNVNPDPFDQDPPTKYEQWNYLVGQAHGQLIIKLNQQIEGLTARVDEHERGHRAANVAALELPKVEQTEKPS
jgi:hypothetical protein